MLCEVLALLRPCADLSSREVPGAGVYYMESLCDRDRLRSCVLAPLLASPGGRPEEVLTGGMTRQGDAASVAAALLAGEAAVFYADGTVVTVKVPGEVSRGINEPETETVLRGPREGFTERAGSNLSLLRRRLATPALKSEKYTFGTKTNTAVWLLWLDGIASDSLLAEVRRRLGKVRVDSVLDSGTVEMAVQDGRAPLFPTVGNSERPDRVAAKLLEGRCALLCDGSPVVLTVPYLFAEALQSTEDYAKSPYYATFVRLLRFVSLLLALYLPALFLALCLFHPGAIPQSLLRKIEETRQGIPFSLFVEVLLTLFLFEMIREVGIRMPKSVGSAVGLAAALVLGDSAVEAGVASAPVLIVVAVAAIGNFLVPPFMNPTILLRILFLIAARLAGIFGIGTVTVALLLHLCAKESFGVPFFSPFAPVSATGMLDFLFMAPYGRMTEIPAPITGKPLSRNGGGT